MSAARLCTSAVDILQAARRYDQHSLKGKWALPVSLLRTAGWEARLRISTRLCLLITKTAQFGIHSRRYILHPKDASTHRLQALTGICLVSAHTRHRHPRREGAFHSMQSIIPAYGRHTYNQTQKHHTRHIHSPQMLAGAASKHTHVMHTIMHTQKTYGVCSLLVLAGALPMYTYVTHTQMTSACL